MTSTDFRAELRALFEAGQIDPQVGLQLPFAAAPQAADIDLRRGFGEGEVGRAEPQWQIVDLEERAAEIDCSTTVKRSASRRLQTE